MQTGKEIHRKTKMVPLKILINYKNPFIHGTLLIKKKVLLSIGMYDENFYYSQDYKLFHDLIKKNFNIRILNKKLYNLNTFNNISSNHYSIQKYYVPKHIQKSHKFQFFLKDQLPNVQFYSYKLPLIYFDFYTILKIL